MIGLGGFVILVAIYSETGTRTWCSFMWLFPFWKQPAILDLTDSILPQISGHSLRYWFYGHLREIPPKEVKCYIVAENSRKRQKYAENVIFC